MARELLVLFLVNLAVAALHRRVFGGNQVDVDDQGDVDPEVDCLRSGSTCCYSSICRRCCKGLVCAASLSLPNFRCV
jgi:hypothetical protein